MMKCPKCEGTLSKVTVKKTADYGGDVLKDAEITDKIDVDQCLSCTGIWFDVDELDQYLAEQLIVLDSDKPREHRQFDRKDADCPKCQQPMEKQRGPKGAGVMMDVCRRCHGVWLDGSEIDRLEKRNFSYGQKVVLLFSYLKSQFQNP